MRLAEGRIPTMEGTLRVQRNSRGSAVEVRADADGIISHAGVGLLVGGVPLMVEKRGRGLPMADPMRRG
jgi:hypothetical protein